MAAGYGVVGASRSLARDQDAEKTWIKITVLTNELVKQTKHTRFFESENRKKVSDGNTKMIEFYRSYIPQQNKRTP